MLERLQHERIRQVCLIGVRWPQATMKRKVLQDHANTFCQMFVGWRMVANDVPALLQLGSGPVAIDVLTGETTHRGAPIRRLYIACELQAWFEHELSAHAIPRDVIRSATLVAEFDASSRSTRRGDRVTLRVICRSRIDTAERSYASELAEDVDIQHVRPSNVRCS